MLRNLLFVFLLNSLAGTPGPALAQGAAPPLPPFTRVQNAEYSLRYQVPTAWHHLGQATDSTLTASYLSPDESMMLFVVKLQGAADRLTPTQALYQLSEQFGTAVNKLFSTRYHRLTFVETTGSGQIDGREMRYDALATQHAGHVLLLYVLATPDAFMTHQPVLDKVLRSFAPYKPGRRDRRQ